MNDQKNLIIAIVASVLIMVTFQYFYERPRIEAHQQAQQEAQQAATGTQQPGTAPAARAPDFQQPAVPATPGAPGAAPPSAAVPPPPAGRADPTGPRIRVDSKSLSGSIALTGGAVDDVVLKGYRETPAETSDNIRLFAPPGGPGAYYAQFGWTPADPQVKVPDATTEWRASTTTLTPGTPVTMTWDNGQGLAFTRRISIDENYMFTVVQQVANTGSTPVTLVPYALINRTGTPKTTGFYILHEGPIGVFDGTLTEIDYDDLVDEKVINRKSTGGWLGITDKYWLAAVVPASDTVVNARFVHWKQGQVDKYQADYTAPARVVAPGGTAESTNYLFSGAKEVRLLDGYAKQYSITNFDLAIDFGWFYFLTKPFFYLLDILFRFFGNFGLAILAVTVMVKILFFPLANKSYKSMSQMKKLQPKMMELKEKFGNDRQRMNQEMMELYKREKVNPASSCLPILIQIPVFFALYKVLFVSIEMRHAPFYGWVKDLSAPDPTSWINLFGILPFAVPAWIPDFISIGLWPIVMGILMYVQMKLNPPPPDPVQARIFMLMPIFFTFIMAPFPAGLVIYWAWNNLLSVAQQYYIMKRMEKAESRSART